MKIEELLMVINEEIFVYNQDNKLLAVIPKPSRYSHTEGFKRLLERYGCYEVDKMTIESKKIDNIEGTITKVYISDIQDGYKIDNGTQMRFIFWV